MATGMDTDNTDKRGKTRIRKESSRSPLHRIQPSDAGQPAARPDSVSERRWILTSPD